MVYKLVNVIVHQCTKFGCIQTHHTEVIGMNNNYKFLLLQFVWSKNACIPKMAKIA